MNIFILDACPIKAATMQVNKSLVKMVLETAQMLSTNVRIISAEVNLDLSAHDQILYKIAHKNHPCTIWARKTRANFDWLSMHGLALCAEYTRRYNRTHKSQAIIELCMTYAHTMPAGELTLPALAVADKTICHTWADIVSAYNIYYESKDYVRKARSTELNISA